MANSHPHVYDHGATIESRSWRAYVPEGVRPYIESAPLAALFLGISSGAAYAMIGATLTTRLAQFGIRKSAVTTFALVFLAYNFKFLWAPLVDTVRIPLLGRFGQRRSWLWVTGVFVMAAVALLGSVDPQQALSTVAIAPLPASNGVGDVGSELAYARAHGFDGLELVNGTEPFAKKLLGKVPLP